MNIAIVGGGAAGLMCGAILRQGGLKATIFDGNEKLGKKLYITGKGRCNLTNVCSPNEYLENVVNGKKFMISAINRFSSFDCVEFFEQNGLKLKIERGNRVFPLSDKASDVTKTLQKLNAGNVIRLNFLVKSIKKDDSGFIVNTSGGKEHFDKVVIATGGQSYSATGSTGDGLKFAQSFGHNVVTPRPALVAIELKDNFVKSLQGLTLKNVTLNAQFDSEKPKQTLSFFGEMMFTDKGITGPIVLTMSSFLNRAKSISLYIDLKPALDEKQLDARLLRDFENSKNKNISSCLALLMPKSLIEPFLQQATIAGDKKVNSITKQEREQIVQTLKGFKLAYKCLYPLESGIVTSGGVDTNQLNPKSCESKLVPGLYFIGEVVDVDCLTGGFNIQAAFSMANACAQDILRKL